MPNPSNNKAVATQPKKKSRRRKRKQNTGAGGMYRSAQQTYVTAPGVSHTNAGLGANRMQNSISKRMGKVPISKEGLSFLKCAFAPPDFDASDVKGFPDDYQGSSLIKKHRFTTSAQTVVGRDTYILLLPIPGVAAMTAQVATGTNILSSTVFFAYQYSDTGIMFPNANLTADNVNKFRYVSNHIEVVNTTNEMSWSGSIQCFKINVQVSTTAGIGVLSLTGLDGCNARGNANQYTGPFNRGVYSGAYSKSGDYAFTPIVEGMNLIPSAIGAADFGQLNCSPYTGFDNNFETICIVLRDGGTANSFMLKTWACVEYIALPKSFIYEYQTLSCRDDNALALYKSIINQLPVGVSYLDNENFWRRVLGIVNTISGGLSVLPGAYGALAMGVNMTTGALQQLTL